MVALINAGPFQGRVELEDVPPEMARLPAHPDAVRAIQVSMFRFNVQSIAHAGFGQQKFRL